VYTGFLSTNQGKRSGMDKYPTVSLTELQKLKAIITSAGDDPRYLDGRVCPYDKPTRELLKSLIPDPVIAATLGQAGEERKKQGRPKAGPVLPMSELEKEFDDLRKEIQSLKTDAKGLEPHERIQVVKTRAALIEKILSMKERIGNINRVEKFVATVIQIMEDELPQDVRLRVIEKFEPYIDEE
jgi:hypothetical protein